MFLVRVAMTAPRNRLATISARVFHADKFNIVVGVAGARYSVIYFEGYRCGSNIGRCKFEFAVTTCQHSTFLLEGADDKTGVRQIFVYFSVYGT